MLSTTGGTAVSGLHAVENRSRGRLTETIRVEIHGASCRAGPECCVTVDHSNLLDPICGFGRRPACPRGLQINKTVRCSLPKRGTVWRAGRVNVAHLLASYSVIRTREIRGQARG